MSGATLIAIDWGTTSARAYKMDARGDVRDERSAPLGIAQLTGRRYDEALAALLGEWRSDPAPRLACGMIGSRQGWIEAAYVACPASLDALADGLATVHDARLSIVPGLITRDRYGTPDVMRGEETQLVGAVGAGEASVLAVLPGTHSKWARVDRGRVVDFTTYMTGELYGVLLSHSILGRLSEPARRSRARPEERVGERLSDADTESARIVATAQGGRGMGERITLATVDAGFLRGVDRGLVSDDVTHAIFGARTQVLAGEMAGTDVDDWLSGLLIGAEIRAARAWAHAGAGDATRVRIIGSDNLVARYEVALARAGISSERADRLAAARGLWRIAAQAGLLH